ncbi:TetR family transcriptional regulator (plasmid) [Azospirillum humicireducens]|uniref:TetR family transcriptional regulator n=1 Tax=Azospirillum humicireducens TaxID=1226968 RepID=A0A2R4VS39_9PROT|nr:TetR family transcriptional regulator [Azospirillum humicireducens]AWB07268.1 TetR family transcriptional regulator [Azospirillum humicireducens]
MSQRRTAKISLKKQPQQARSTELVATILDAAVQVLAKEGANRFTTARVAEKAGVSVGSLYQYFPNKAAILFRLQCDEWRQTTEMLRTILQDGGEAPDDRLRTLVHVFLRSECEEAAVRIALDDAAPLYRDAPEALEAKAAADRVFSAFIAEYLPGLTDEKRKVAADLIIATLTSVGKQFSETPRIASEVDAYADAMADMFSSYLAALIRQPAGDPGPGPGPGRAVA